MKTGTPLFLALLPVLAAMPANADPIEGKWFTPMRETVRIDRCGSTWCATVVTGEYAGTGIGTFSGTDGTYSARITEPKNGRSIDAKASLTGTVLRLRGCLAGVMCSTREWKRM